MRIVETHVREGLPISDPAQLADDIRRAIVQGQVAARQPEELDTERVSAIVWQIVQFIHEYEMKLNAAVYPDQANALQECKRRVLALHRGEVERKPVASIDSERKAAYG